MPTERGTSKGLKTSLSCKSSSPNRVRNRSTTRLASALLIATYETTRRHRLTRSLVLHRGCPWDKSCFRIQLEAATIANAQRLRASCLPTTPLSSRSLLAPLSKKKWNYSELAKRQVSTFYFHHSPKSFIAKCNLDTTIFGFALTEEHFTFRLLYALAN